jgi:hypothetical protein
MRDLEVAEQAVMDALATLEAAREHLEVAIRRERARAHLRIVRPSRMATQP